MASVGLSPRTAARRQLAGHRRPWRRCCVCGTQCVGEQGLNDVRVRQAPLGLFRRHSPPNRSSRHVARGGRHPRAETVPHDIRPVIQFGPQRPPGSDEKHPAPGGSDRDWAQGVRSQGVQLHGALAECCWHLKHIKFSTGGQQHRVRRPTPPATHLSGLGRCRTGPGFQCRMAGRDQAARPAADEARSDQSGTRRHHPSVRGVTKRRAAQPHPVKLIEKGRWYERLTGAPLHGLIPPDLGGRLPYRPSMPYPSATHFVGPGRSTLCKLQEKYEHL